MKRWLCLFLLAVLTGCASMDVKDYMADEPKLELPKYFSGTLDAWGMFQDRSGKVIKRFHVVIETSWKSEGGRPVGTLDEHFRYSDGTTQRRVWTLTQQADGSWRGRADDVVGEAVGEVSGNALRWRYVLALPVDGKVYHVKFDDWMFLIDDKVMLNRSFMSKFGFALGQVTLSFTKR